MQLIKALRYSHPSIVAFVGAGGKTTAIFRTARELLATNNKGVVTGKFSVETVLVTTSTHFGAWQKCFADHVLVINTTQDLEKLGKQLPKGVVLLTGDIKDNRLVGLGPKLLDYLYRLSNDLKLPLLIEADGSHSLSLKAPADHEPVIPDFTQQVVVVAGLSGIGRPLSEQWVHRSVEFGELTGMQPGEVITAEHVVKMLLNMEGGLKKIPRNARKTALLTQAQTPDLQLQGKLIGENLITRFHGAIIASFFMGNDAIPTGENETPAEVNEIHAVIEPTGAVILAAGESSRFGEPKQLLRWKEIPFIRHVAINALKAGLSPVTVVLGSSADEVRSAIDDLPLRIVNNFEWKKGMSSSVKVGLETQIGEVGGIVFLQADQPHIPPELIRSLVEAHKASLNPIVAPQIDGQRGNPVLFDVETFSDLLLIEGDIGGRALFSQYPIEWIPWNERNLLIDIDSSDDYRNFLVAYPEGEWNYDLSYRTGGWAIQAHGSTENVTAMGIDNSNWYNH